MADIKTVAGFLDKYPLSKGIDQDKGTEGVQNDRYPVDELVADYNVLSNEDKFVVFKIFEKCDEKELLKILTDYKNSGSGSSSGNLFLSTLKTMDRFRDDVLIRAHNNEEVWGIRLQIAGGLFILKERFKTAEYEALVGGRTDDIERFREKMFTKLVKLYKDTDKQYWDTDNDFCTSCEAGLGEYYFDHKDHMPLVPSYPDTDGDEVSDDKDSDPKSPGEWNKMETGTVYGGRQCDIVRSSDDTYTITVKIHLKTLKCDEDYASKKSDPSYLKVISQGAEEAFRKYREETAGNIGLKIEFVDSPEKAHHVVRFSQDENYRAHAKEWREECFNDPAVLLHEVLHLLGLPDYYTEFLVHDGIRDHTFQPGFGVLEENNIMKSSRNKAAIIAEYQLKDIIVRNVHPKRPDPEETEQPEQQPRQQSVKEVMIAQREELLLQVHDLYSNDGWRCLDNSCETKIFDGIYILGVVDGLDKLISKDSKDFNALLDKARLLHILKLDEPARWAYRSLLQDAHTPDNIFICAGDGLYNIDHKYREEAIELLKGRAVSSPDTAFWLAGRLHDMGRVEEALNVIEPHVFESLFYAKLVCSYLYELKRYDRLLEFSEKLLAEYGETAGPNIVADIISYRVFVSLEYNNTADVEKSFRELSMAKNGWFYANKIRGYLIDHGRSEKLVQLMNDANFDNDPMRQDIFHDCANYAYKKGDHAGALLFFREIKKGSFPSELSFTQYIDSLIKTGNKKEATDMLMKMLAVDPYNLSVRRLLLQVFVMDISLNLKDHVAVAVAIIEFISVCDKIEVQHGLETGVSCPDEISSLKMDDKTRAALIGLLKKPGNRRDFLWFPPRYRQIAIDALEKGAQKNH